MWIIYKVTNKMNGMSYIGCTGRMLHQRMASHYSKAKKGSDFKFHKALNETTQDVWTWEVIDMSDSRQNALRKESQYIQSIGTIENGYNNKPGYGKATPELIEKFRQAKLGYVPWNKGKTNIYSEETRSKMANAKLGTKRPKWSDERREVMKQKLSMPIIEVKSGLEFKSQVEAANYFGIRREQVRDVVNGRRNHTKGLIFKQKEQ